MKKWKKTMLPAALMLAGGFTVGAQTPAPPEVEDLKSKMRSMEQAMQEMKQRLVELEGHEAARVTSAGTNNVMSSGAGADRVSFWPATREVVGHASPIEDRGTLNNQQE